jgi:hypothetical protein
MCTGCPFGDTGRIMTSKKRERPRTQRTFPVSVTQLPLVRCAVCGRTIAHQPGRASEVLTSHYEQAHADIVR